MALDAAVLKALCGELSATFKGAKVKTLEQIDQWELVIETSRGCLVVSCHPRFKRLMSVEIKEDGIPTHFARTAGKLVEGARITGVNQKDLERIAEIGFEKRDVLDKTVKYKLIAELVGSSGNAILLTSADRVVTYLRKTKRNVAGHTYRPPRHPGWVDPEVLDKDGLIEVMLEDKGAVLRERIQKCMMGFGPLLSREVVHRSGLNIEKTVADCSRAELVRVAEEVAEIYEDVVKERFSPSVYYKGEDAVEVSCLKLSHLAELKHKGFKSMNGAVAEFCSKPVQAHRLEEKKRFLLKAVEKKTRSKKTLFEKQRKDLKEAQKCDEYKAMGDAILMSLGRIRKGATQVLLESPMEPERRLKISLTRGKSPQETAQGYYKRYKRLKKARPVIKKRLASSKDAVTHLESLKDSLEKASSKADLDRLREVLVKEGLLHRMTARRGKVEKQYRRFITSRGWEVVVGRSARENDEITFHLAKPKDLFFHVSSASGSHTIMRVQGTGRVPGKKDIEEVASIAAYYSKARTSRVVPVAYTERRYVRKPRKAPPGTVLVEREKVVMAEPHKPATTPKP